VLIRKITLLAYTVVSVGLLSAVAEAKSTKTDQAPPPPAVPVPKVDQSTLQPLAPQSLEGPAKAVSGDRISLGDYQVRLYGIAAPDMGTERGPASRLALDSLLDGQRVKCTIFGKAPSSELLGQCSAGTTDLARQLLSQGLAAVYRDGMAGNEDAANLDSAYDATEAQARQAGLGIWTKPAAAATAETRTEPREPLFSRAALAYIFALITVLTIPITMVSLWRSSSHQREKRQTARRYTMASGLVAEAEIIRAVARQILTQIAELPKERPVPTAIAPMLTLPTASFWSANAERLELLPVEVTVPLLRLYALHEEAVRKLALAANIPAGAVVGALSAVETAADRAIDTIESAMGITRERPLEPAAEPAMAVTPKAAAQPTSSSSPETPAAPRTPPQPTTTQIADSAPLPR
jgi:endonuclease YncB( thermonuclease family)